MAELDDDLYRSCKTRDWGGRADSASQRTTAFAAAYGKGSLYPDYKGRIQKDGTPRPPDVTTFNEGGAVWVRGVNDRKPDGDAFVSWKEGVSASMTPGGFGYSGWFYFLLPKGTPIRGDLDVRHTPSRNDDGHHSIRCLNRMRQDAYEGALDNLARSALVQAIKDGRQSLLFSPQ